MPSGSRPGYNVGRGVRETLPLFPDVECHRMSAAPPRPALPYRTALAIAVGSAVCVMVITILAGGGRGVVRPPADSLVYTVEGTGTAEVKDWFEVRDGWELRWEKSGPMDEIRWTRDTGESGSAQGLPQQPLRDYGSVNVARGGKYRFSTKGTGRWKITVYQFDVSQ